MFADKNKAYKFAPQSLKILASSLMGENGKILPAVFEKFYQKMSTILARVSCSRAKANDTEEILSVPVKRIDKLKQI